MNLLLRYRPNRATWLLAAALVVGLAFAAVACDDDTTDGEGPTMTVPADTLEPTAADEAAGGEPDGGASGGETDGGSPPMGEAPTATPTPSREIAPVMMETSPDNPPYASLLAGSATMTENDSGGTDISVTVSGIDYEILGVVVPSLREGTCESPGEVHVTLPEHVTNIGEDVTVDTTIDDPPYSHWLDVPHHIAVYNLGGDLLLACGNVLPAP